MCSMSPIKSPRKVSNSSDFFSITQNEQPSTRHSLCTTTLSHYHPTQAHYMHPFFSQKNLQEFYLLPLRLSQQKVPQYDDITHSIASQEYYYTSMNELSYDKLSPQGHLLNHPEIISGIGKIGSRSFEFLLI